MFTEIGDRKHWHEVPDDDIVMTKDQLSKGISSWARERTI